MKRQITNVIESTEPIERQYDSHCKNILANKYILANILKYTVKEVEDMSIADIASCIDGDPDISSIGVLEGTDLIKGDNTEDNSVNEGTVYYDIRFTLFTDDNGKKLKILFDTEAQKKYNPGYKIVTRGIVYGARMISSQINSEFDLEHYDGLKKVYSIWICFNSPNYIGNAISRYSIAKEDIIPGIPDNKSAYDKLTVIEVCLNKSKDSSNKLIKMLKLIFTGNKSAKETTTELENIYDVPSHYGLRKEIDYMCNLSGMILEQGIEKGIEQGIERGIEKGIEQGKKQGIKQGIEQGIKRGKEETLIKLVLKGAIQIEEAAKELGVSVDEFKKLISKYQKQNTSMNIF